jgi:chemotaxis protein MotA
MADAPKNKTPSKRPDLATIAGLALAALGIVGGLLLEGGEISDIAQLTAAIIVLGGTFGAVLINTPLATFLGAMRRLVAVFFEPSTHGPALLDKLVGYATRARKAGVVSLEQEAQSATDPYLRKALGLAVDGTDIQELRKMLEMQIDMDEHHAESEAKVFESAGGYAPTIGIIGAVMGLIQVMKNLSDIDKVGHGIAVSFVATVYGVAVANIFFLPVANKIKARANQESRMKEMILEGVVAIVEGMNPKLVQTKLESFLHGGEAKAAPAAPAKGKA